MRGVTQVQREPADGTTQGFIRSAAILSIGNIIGRMLGLLSATVMNSIFGAARVAAFEKAAWIPLTLRELFVGGMVDSALVPVFSDLAQREKREALWSGVSAFLSVTVVVLLGAILLVEAFTQPIAWAVGVYEFDDPQLVALGERMMRITTPAVLFLSLASIFTSVLYALKRFLIPAFLTSVFNATLVIFALLRPDNVMSLAYALLVGSVLQVLAQLPALRGARLRWQLAWRHPVLRRIVRLYLPVIGGLLVNTAVVALSYNLATRTGDASQTYMRNATRLIQFPDGLVVTAISIAILPTLTREAALTLARREAAVGGAVTADRFRPTLATGIRLVLVLILPATAGLFALARPIVDLLFGYGAYTAADVTQTALVLQVYLLGLPFAGVDRMLVFASYARHDTVRPALVGVVSMLVNAVVAIALLRSLGLFSLMVADVVKHLLHTALMYVWLRRQVGGLRGFGISQTVLKATVAAVLTGVVAFGVDWWIAGLPLAGIWLSLGRVVAAGGAGLICYAACVRLFRIQELWHLRARLGRGRGVEDAPR